MGCTGSDARPDGAVLAGTGARAGTALGPAAPGRKPQGYQAGVNRGQRGSGRGCLAPGESARRYMTRCYTACCPARPPPRRRRSRRAIADTEVRGSAGLRLELQDLAVDQPLARMPHQQLRQPVPATRPVGQMTAHRQTEVSLPPPAVLAGGYQCAASRVAGEVTVRRRVEARAALGGLRRLKVPAQAAAAAEQWGPHQDPAAMAAAPLENPAALDPG